MTQALSSIFLGMNVSFHRDVSGGGRAKVPDPSPTPVLASLHTVLPLPIFSFLISSFMTDGSFWTNCLAFSSFLNPCTISLWTCCLESCSFLNPSSILELVSSLRFSGSFLITFYFVPQAVHVPHQICNIPRERHEQGQYFCRPVMGSSVVDLATETILLPFGNQS